MELAWIDNSSNETGFGIWRRRGMQEWIRIGVVPPNTTRYIDPGLDANTRRYEGWGLDPNTTYTYRLRAHNDQEASAWSNEATSTTPNVPGALAGLRAGAVSDTRISLWWAGWPHPSAWSVRDTWISIWRRRSDTAWERIGVVPAITWVFDDDTVRPGAVYTYRLRLYNGVGVSAWSNEARAATTSIATVHVSVPVVASDSTSTRVDTTFRLPADYILIGNPRILVIYGSGSLATLKSAYVIQRPPEGIGYQYLNTPGYPAAEYLVRAEIDYRRPDGEIATAMSEWSPMTVLPQ
jgi:titin